MAIYSKYKQILHQIKVIAELNPLNVAGCEQALHIIENLLKEAKEVKVGK